MKTEIYGLTPNRWPRQGELDRHLKRLFSLLRRKVRKRGAAKKLKAAQTVTVTFVGPKLQTKLNSQFRGRKKPTDVLSFAPVEAASLGELSICLSVIRRDAKRNGVTRDEQLIYILLHGLMHLLGYDHETHDKGAREMYDLQDQIFAKIRERWL